MSIIHKLAEQVLNGKILSYDEVRPLLFVDNDEILELLLAANKITKKFNESRVELCSIAAGKVGNCSEDCAFCAQSIHYNTPAEEINYLDCRGIVEKAVRAEQQGVHRFSLVNSGYGPSWEEFYQVLDIIKKIKQKTRLKLCASLGVINKEMARLLKEAGITMYHHNIETCSTYYPKICTTHSYEDRINTIRAAKQAGLNICCGGIISLGETPEHRLKMAYEIRELDADSVPINILNPIPGTPLEGQEVLPPLEILKTIAVFRFVMPDKLIRLAGGRVTGLRDLQPLAFLAGANAAITGDYLTTYGRSVEQDIKMLKDLELISVHS